MNDRSLTSKSLKSIRIPYPSVLAACILLAGGIFASWLAIATDRTMRRDLAEHAQIIANMLDVTQIRSFQGTEEDSNSREYQELKKRLQVTRSIDPQIRFIYLLGQREDSTIYFIIDSESADSIDYSPPGQVYEEASSELKEIFKRKSTTVFGPGADRWGIWISAIVPIEDPATDEVIAFLGMDTEASSWQWKVIRSTFVPLIVSILLAGSIILGSLLRSKRKKIENALHESEAVLHSILDSTPSGVTLLTNRHFIKVNEAFCRITGYSESELLTESSRMIFPDDSEFERVGMELYGEMEKKGIGEIEAQMQRKDKTVIDVILSIAPFSDTGSKTNVCMSVLDITGRKRSETALRSSQAVLQSILDATPAGIALLDNRKFVLVNNMLCTITGYSENEILGQSTRILYPNDEEYSRIGSELYASMVNTGLGMSEALLRNKNGSPIEVILCLTPYDPADPTGRVCATVLDVTEKNKAEDALRVSEEYLRSIFRSTPTGIGVTINRTIVQVNTRLCEMTGYSEEELIGEDSRMLYLSEEEYELVGRERNRQVALSGTGTIETRWVRKDGGIIDVLFNSTPINHEDHLKGMTFTALDITKRVEAEAEVKLNESRLDTLVSLSQMTKTSLKDLTDFTLEKAIELTQSRIGYLAFMSVDQTILTMHSWSNSVMQECSMDEKPIIYPVETTGLWGEAVRQRKPVITNDYQAPNTLKKGYPEGHVHLVRHMNIPVFDGDKIVAVAGVGNKDTDYNDGDTRQLTLLMEGMWRLIQRKNAEQELADSEEKYRLLIENNHDIIFTVSKEGLFTFVSPAWTKLLGHDVESVSGTSFTSFLHPEDAKGFIEYLDRGIRTKDSLEEFEYRIRHTDESWRWHMSSVVPLLDADGEVVSFYGISRDVTERKLAEEEKERLETQLRQIQKMESVGRLAGGVAHDFNNMLSVIIGHTEMALENTDPGQPLYADLLEVKGAAVRSAELTRQLLAFARKQTVAPKVLDLNSTVEGMMKMLKRLIGENIDLVWQPGEKLWSVKIDPSQLDQILTNFCVNSRDAISGIGRVAIETSNRSISDDYEAERLGAVPGDYVQLSVSDNGRGMNKETLSHVFEPFFTTKDTGKGTGLGLSTIYGIVKQNNGYIDVYSEPGIGTTFTIYLPRHDSESEDKRPVIQTLDAVTPGKTVMIVEDEATILGMTTRMLKSKGFSVLPASTPQEAIEIAKAFDGAIDMLMTDVIMPEMNGRELASLVQSFHPNIKTMFMSGYPSNVIAHHGVLEEGVQFIQKPFSMSDLIAKVRETLDPGTDGDDENK